MGFVKKYSLLLIMLVPDPVRAQLDLGQNEDFLEVVAPIITEGERQIYERLPDFDSRKYFKAVFWYKRDPQPETADNAYRRAFYERRRLALDRFAEESTPGTRTDRGIVFLLLGEPDNVNQQRLTNTGLRIGYEEMWHYQAHNFDLRFVFDGRTPHYKLDNAEQLKPVFERIRNSQVLDRAEPFVQNPIPLTLPNLGFTKDIENLAADDKFDLNFALSFYYFRGDLNRTEVMVAITFNDASNRGMDVHLAAFDPYTNKTREIKKLIEPENGKLEFLFLPLEPDQYDMILRLHDRDGREGTYRANIDVPRIGATPSASSLLLAGAMQPVPLFGFSRPKKFVFDTHFFPVEQRFKGFAGDSLYLMQIFYKFSEKPDLHYFLDNLEVPAKVEAEVTDEEGMRLVVSIPVRGITSGKHLVRSVYRNASGDLVTQSVNWVIDDQRTDGDLIGAATVSDQFQIIHPAGNDITDMDRIAVRIDESLVPRRLYLFLNGRLIMERDKTPWEVFVDEDRFSTSGDNTIVAVLDTDQGLLKDSKRFKPLRIDQKIQSRVVQIFFNAYNEDLAFIHDLDLDKLQVTVDNQTFKPMSAEKLDDPITYCFVVDTSYSMKDSFTSNISALKLFIESMRPQDKGFFVAIDNNYTQLLEPNQSKAVLLAVVENLKLQRLNPKFGNSLHEENTTYLYDGMIAAIHSLLQYTGRTVILLVSDGIGIEGSYSRNGMLAYARENNVVIYSLWLDNNPKLSEDETRFLQREKTGGEKFARKIGLSRFFSKKDAKLTHISNKVRHASIAEGLLKIMAEESGGFHYRIFRADRTLIRDYVEDIEEAVESQFVMALNLPVSLRDYEIEITSSEPGIEIRNKSKVKVRDSNPLID